MLVKKHIKIFKTCNLYLSFLTLGMSISLTGPCLLDLQHMVRTDTRHIALIYTARSIGYLVGAISGGILLDIMKSKQSVITGCNFVVTITMFGIPWNRDFKTLMGFMVVNGLSLGAIETGGNVVCLQLWGKDSGPFFQALHFAFGLGGLVSPLIAAPFLDNMKDLTHSIENSTNIKHPINLKDTIPSCMNDTGNDFTKIVYPFSIVGAFCAFATCLLLFVCIVSPAEDQEPQEEKINDTNKSFVFMFFTVTFTFLLFFVAAGTEIGYAQTLTTYAVKGRLHTTTTVGSYMTSAFWAAFTLSRLVSVFLAIKVNSLVLIISDICIVSVSALILLFLMPNEWALWLASVVFGAGIASCYPALVGWLDNHINITNKISAIFTVGCAAGEMVVPFIIAYFMEIIPEMLAFVTAASSVLLTFLLFTLYCIFKNSNSKTKQDIKEDTKEDKKVECYVLGNFSERDL